MFNDIPEARKLGQEYIDWFPDAVYAEEMYAGRHEVIEPLYIKYVEKYKAAINAMVELEEAYVGMDAALDGYYEKDEW
jgi:hypothetical protein